MIIDNLIYLIVAMVLLFICIDIPLGIVSKKWQKAWRKRLKKALKALALLPFRMIRGLYRLLTGKPKQRSNQRNNNQ